MIDAEHRCTWDDNCEVSTIAARDERTGEQVVYTHTRWPFPMTDRHYYFHQRGHEDGTGTYFVINVSLEDSDALP